MLSNINMTLSLCLCVSLSQGLSVLLVFTVLNSEVQEAWRAVCLGKKSPGEDPPRPPQTAVSWTPSPTNPPTSPHAIQCSLTVYYHTINC